MKSHVDALAPSARRVTISFSVLLLATFGFSKLVHAQPVPAAEAPPETTPPLVTPDPPSSAPPGGETSPAPDAEPAEAPPADGAPESATTEVSEGSGLFEASLSGSSSEAESSEAPPFTLTGYVRGDVYIGKDPGDSEAEMKAAYGELGLGIRTRKQEYGDGFADVRVRYGLQGDERRTFLELREAYVNAYAGPLDLRLGQQIVVWGRADAFNPTNNITPYDLRVRSPIEDDRRVGNIGARGFLNFAPLRLEGVFMPLYLPSELPTFEMPQYIYFVEPRYPPFEFDRSLIATRLHLELPAFEASVSYLYGHAPLPGIEFVGRTELGTDPPEIYVRRSAYDHHVVGFDFSTAVSDLFALRGEAAYRSPLHHERRTEAPRRDLQYVLGADRAFGSVSVIAQYMGRYTFDWERDGSEEPLDPIFLARLGRGDETLIGPQVNAQIREEIERTNQMLFNQLEEIQHLATVRLEWLTLHETLSLSALVMTNFSTEEYLLSPKIAYRPSDVLTATIGAEVLGGPDGTLFGRIDEQLSAGYAELRVSY